MIEQLTEKTENLLYKLEERMMSLLTTSERLQQENAVLRQENASLRQDKDNHTRKLQDLVSLLDSVNPVEQQPLLNTAYVASAVSLVQG